MRVLVLGATGFIGLPVVQALVRSGHIVHGVTRSAEKAKQLAAEEVIPIIGEYEDVAAWAPLVAKLDAVIDAIGGAQLKVLGPHILNATAEAVKQYRPAHATKLAFIYTSGTWVHGENRKDIITDTTPLTISVELTAWRPEHEQNIIHHPALNGIVIRPSLLYGKSASLIGILFKTAYDGEVTWYGTPGGRMALIHCDDLAVAYLLATEKASIVGGQIFDISNDFSEGTDDILQRLVGVSGAKGYKYVAPTNLFEVALSTTHLLRPYLARSLLGWQPRKAGLGDHLEIYYNAWKASAGLN